MSQKFIKKDWKAVYLQGCAIIVYLLANNDLLILPDDYKVALNYYI